MPVSMSCSHSFSFSPRLHFLLNFLYILIMLGNDGRLVSGELGGLGACLMILLLISAVYYAVYRYTVHRMCAELEV